MEYRFVDKVDEGMIKSYVEMTNQVLKIEHSIGFVEDLDLDFAKKFLQFSITEPKSALLMVFSGTSVVGTGYISASGYDTTEHYAKISKVMVDVHWRRKGVGKEIMKVLEKKAKEMGYTHIMLDTWDIPYIVNFYKKCGYKVVGQVPDFVNYKGKYYDSFIFAKKLK
jgi:ribosomal protein S18 acetylase RimI-like enzyme